VPEQRKAIFRPFRPEIEGLRAIAAMLVAVFHIWLGRVSGGVDVFFVVSSFLITLGLLGELDRLSLLCRNERRR
jgi:peptidoglycan/LPS O-acetylase OafA/YrhL